MNVTHIYRICSLRRGQRGKCVSHRSRSHRIDFRFLQNAARMFICLGLYIDSIYSYMWPRLQIRWLGSPLKLQCFYRNYAHKSLTDNTHTSNSNIQRNINENISTRICGLHARISFSSTPKNDYWFIQWWGNLRRLNVFNGVCAAIKSFVEALT